MTKRLSAVIILNESRVVNAYQFKFHLPVGRLLFTLQRLQDLEIDDFIILNRTHSRYPENDFEELMHDLSELHITTPITYGGGIDNHHQAAAIVKLGAERICIGPTKSQDESLITSISESLGEQSIVMHIPLRVNSDGNLSDALEVRALNKINNFLPARWGGEILLTNVSGDGATHANVRGLTKASECVSQKAKVILSGGFNTIEEISAAYSSPAVSAVAIGNMLHRVEVPVLKIKSKLSMLLRPRGEK